MTDRDFESEAREAKARDIRDLIEGFPASIKRGMSDYQYALQLKRSTFDALARVVRPDSTVRGCSDLTRSMVLELLSEEEAA